MTDAPQPDERQECRHVSRLLLRGYLLAALAGLIWALPASHLLIQSIVAVMAGWLFFLSMLPLILAAAGLRGIAFRIFGLDDRRGLARAIGYALLAIFLVVDVLVFQLGGLLVDTLNGSATSPV